MARGNTLTLKIGNTVTNTLTLKDLTLKHSYPKTLTLRHPNPKNPYSKNPNSKTPNP